MPYSIVQVRLAYLSLTSTSCSLGGACMRFRMRVSRLPSSKVGEYLTEALVAADGGEGVSELLSLLTCEGDSYHFE